MLIILLNKKYKKLIRNLLWVEYVWIHACSIRNLDEILISFKFEFKLVKIQTRIELKLFQLKAWAIYTTTLL